MSRATLPEVREGYFPHWKLKTTGVIMPEERLPWGQTIVSGLQHGVAMAGGASRLSNPGKSSALPRIPSATRPGSNRTENITPVRSDMTTYHH